MRTLHVLALAGLVLLLTTCNELPKRILPGAALRAGKGASSSAGIQR